MRFKKSKKEILQQINNVYPYANNIPELNNMTPYEFKNRIEQYARDVSKSYMDEAMRILMDNIYTEEEFEVDIGLKS